MFLDQNTLKTGFMIILLIYGLNMFLTQAGVFVSVVAKIHSIWNMNFVH